MPRLRYATKEQFLVILLNSKNKVIGTELVSEGSLTNSVVHPREVFLPAILQHAASICVAHNHPSGDPMPSIEDRQLTAVCWRQDKPKGDSASGPSDYRGRCLLQLSGRWSIRSLGG